MAKEIITTTTTTRIEREIEPKDDSGPNSLWGKVMWLFIIFFLMTHLIGRNQRDSQPWMETHQNNNRGTIENYNGIIIQPRLEAEKE